MRKQREELADLAQQESKFPVILASSSPRRAELLRLIYQKFSVLSPASESEGNFASPLEEAAAKAHEKGLEIFSQNRDSLVISGDTIVVVEDKVLGKPKTFQQAESMLRLLSGREHKVICAVSIFAPDICQSFSSETSVHFYPLSDEEISAYINTEKPFDKAGGYGIQGEAAKFIERIDGDFYSVMGLPVSLLYQKLKKFNLI